ncbi:hypothetical protein Slin15195_G059870 [Septoria linicola]|uniref:Uncharacterized protein n=1 Tax=Septoria linicola TaxID=215465 RepID=A0A9Q9EKS0_9PEZI|nr:hypothetical protein Slin15195_G059870 [Septoria linicola]
MSLQEQTSHKPTATPGFGSVCPGLMTAWAPEIQKRFIEPLELLSHWTTSAARRDLESEISAPPLPHLPLFPPPDSLLWSTVVPPEVERGELLILLSTTP